jgi:hypothetical protein
MSGRHKLFLGLTVAALLLVWPVSVALAQEGTESPAEHTLTASGYGRAQLLGWESVDIHAHGASIIWVSGGDTLEISGDGEREDMDDGLVRLTDWEGEIHVAGARVGVRMAGGHLDFAATGRGRVLLQGHGTFQIDDHEGRWTWPGLRIPRRRQLPAL